MTVNSGALCDAGRCAAILEHVAKQQQQAADRLGCRAERVVIGALTELGVDATDGAVRVAVANAIRRLLDDSPDGLVG